MRLSDYLTQNNITDAVFAEKIGVTRQAVHRYRNGGRRPDWATMAAIVRETNDAVTPDDFLTVAAAE